MGLPVGGLMSEKTAEKVMAELDPANQAATALGCPLPAPFMTLSFISPPAAPEPGLTDYCLIDVLVHKMIPLEMAEQIRGLAQKRSGLAAKARYAFILRESCLRKAPGIFSREAFCVLQIERHQEAREIYED